MTLLKNLEKLLMKLQTLRNRKSVKLVTQDMSALVLSGEWSMVRQSLALQRQGFYLSVLLVSDFRAERPLKSYGQDLNSVVKDLSNSQLGREDMVVDQEAGSFTQAFAKFSLN